MEARPGAGRSLDRSIDVPQKEFVGGLRTSRKLPRRRRRGRMAVVLVSSGAAGRATGALQRGRRAGCARRLLPHFHRQQPPSPGTLLGRKCPAAHTRARRASNQRPRRAAGAGRAVSSLPVKSRGAVLRWRPRPMRGRARVASLVDFFTRSKSITQSDKPALGSPRRPRVVKYKYAPPLTCVISLRA